MRFAHLPITPSRTPPGGRPPDPPAVGSADKSRLPCAMSAFTDTTHGVRGSTDHSNLKAQRLRQQDQSNVKAFKANTHGHCHRPLSLAFDFGF
jgi:hypothetical protein